MLAMLAVLRANTQTGSSCMRKAAALSTTIADRAGLRSEGTGTSRSYLGTSGLGTEHESEKIFFILNRFPIPI
eukprot:2400057-Rhodomonas_salina.1